MTLHEYVVEPFTQFAFMRRALAACLALALGCGPIGIFLMLRRMSLMGDALSHALLPGVALGFLWAGFSLTAMTIGGFVAGLVVVLLAGTAARFTLLREDASFASFQLISMALGVLIVSTKGSNVNLMHILFGSVLAVDDQSLVVTAAIASLSLLLMAFLYRPLIIDSFDPGYLQRAQGVSAARWQLLFLAVVAMDLVAGFQSMGALMVVGIMMLPAISARFWAREIWSLMAVGMLLALLAGVLGLLLSFHYRLPSGPAIILTAGVLHIFSLLFAPLGVVRSRFVRRGPHRQG